MQSNSLEQQHRWKFNNRVQLVQKYNPCMCTRRSALLCTGRLPVQLHLAAREELWTSAGWCPAMFSLQACRGELRCYILFHTSVRGQTQQPPPKERLLFCSSIPCLGWGRLVRTGEEGVFLPANQSVQDQGQKKTWFKSNCPVLSLCNEAREVIKMLTGLPKIPIRSLH